MKKLCLCILFVLLLPVTSSFAATVTGQQIFMPYTIVGNGFWSGLAVTSVNADAMTFTIRAYKVDGSHVDGSSFSVEPMAKKVDALQNFFGGTPPDQMMSIRIRTTTNEPFKATLFIGNDQGGFGFQDYNSNEKTW